MITQHFITKKIVGLLFVTAILLLTACSTQNSQPVVPAEDAFGIPAGQEEAVKTAFTENMKKVACEDSAGTFANGKCVCPKDFELNNETNQCEDAFGLPGGAAGGEVKKAFTENMKKVACEDSAGTFANGKCVCPKDFELNNETNQCEDAFGLPGGAAGEEIKVKHPLNQ